MEEDIRNAGFKGAIEPWHNFKPRQRLGWKGKGTPRARDADTAKRGWAWWPAKNPNSPFSKVSVAGEYYAPVSLSLLKKMLQELTTAQILTWFRLGEKDKGLPQQWLQSSEIQNADDLGVTIEEIKEFLGRITKGE